MLLAGLTDTDQPHLLRVAFDDEDVKKPVTTAVAGPVASPPLAELAATDDAGEVSESQVVESSTDIPWWLPIVLASGLLGPWIWTYRRPVASSLAVLRHRIGL